MKFEILPNGIEVIYKKVEGNLTSFCVGFEAGANRENEDEIGVAHALEHMLYKGTKSRSEFQINMELDNLFGFNNAMTNYPYAIYYGTCHNKDFASAVELISDILLNPIFNEDGFQEEMEIIKVESREWKDDLNQYCEDELLYNAFNKKRIKEMIIGNEEHLNKITLNKLKEFYNKYYFGHNCVISVVTSLEWEKIIEEIYKYFKDMPKGLPNRIKVINEEINEGVYRKQEDIKGAKIQVLFNIENFNKREKEILQIINAYAAMGTSSILYDKIRTKNCLAYEVYSEIKSDKGIGTYKLCLGTDKDKVYKCLDILNEVVEEMFNKANSITKEEINILCNRVNRNKEIQLERSIEVAKRLCYNTLMFNDKNLTYEDCGWKEISRLEIINVLKKLTERKAINILG